MNRRIDDGLAVCQGLRLVVTQVLNNQGTLLLDSWQLSRLRSFLETVRTTLEVPDRSTSKGDRWQQMVEKNKQVVQGVRLTLSAFLRPDPCCPSPVDPAHSPSSNFTLTTPVDREQPVPRVTGLQSHTPPLIQEPGRVSSFLTKNTAISVETDSSRSSTFPTEATGQKHPRPVSAFGGSPFSVTHALNRELPLITSVEAVTPSIDVGDPQSFAGTIAPPVPKEVAQSFVTTTQVAAAKGDVAMDTEQQLSASSKERKVPVSRFRRLLSYSNLAVGLGLGALSEVTKRSLGLSDTKGTAKNPFLSESNVERIVNTLCRVRGAALKLGQMLSIQDNALISPEVQALFDRVRYSADFMPSWQAKKMLRQEYGDDWERRFEAFEEKPFAAASIGQVHRVVLKSGEEAALKIQYPGVAKSIESDISNLLSVLSLGSVLPRGLFLDNFAKVMSRELALECDYLMEAKAAKRFKKLLASDTDFYVPRIFDEYTTRHVLCIEMIGGIAVDKCVDFDQQVRDWVGKKILDLCLRELFEFQYMQTDPNWSNFFYDVDKKKIILLDFGASRTYDPKFVHQYRKILKAAHDEDREAILKHSRDIGFLTGYESKIMENAHCDAVMTLGEAFRSAGYFDFGVQGTTARINRLIPVMIEHRLKPPPEEIYSLHRKLAGAFLLCSKLKSRVQCSELFRPVYEMADSD